MTDYWLSTKSPKRIFKPSYETPELDKVMTESAGIDPAVVASYTPLSAPQVRAYQRRLGLRKITGNPPRASS